MDDTTPLPTGTVTFLFTDIEGSTRLWEQHPQAMRLALARHHALLTEGIRQCGGVIVKSRGEGDSLFAVFTRAPDALAAACRLQQTLSAEAWPLEAALRVRIALHTGEADLQEGDYYGPAVNRCARLRAVAHGGQVVLSQTTWAAVQDSIPAGGSLRDLGAHRLKDLQQTEHLFQLLHPDLPSDFPPLRSLEAFTHNLPAQVTSFIGREREIAEVKRLLGSTRLLTLTGAGGCGKTRLALQVAADLVEEFTHGVWLVELAALVDPGLVPQTMASALGVREEPGRPLPATLADYLRPKALLLVLDNCEHLLAACAELPHELLRSCPRLQILATSREGLGIAGELTYRVPSLPLPDPNHVPAPEEMRQFDAVHLFLERARFSQPTFAVTARNAAAVVQVCQRLDGIPLAIELAAARLKALPVEQIATRLDDCFRLLTGGSRTALPRQQTLRALIDWSYDLLSEEERVLLRRLSVFAGGWRLEAAEAVCSCGDNEAWQILDLLTALVEKSLVVYEEREGQARYRLPETVRQYSRDRLLEAGETTLVRERHLVFFLQLATEAEPQLRGPEQAKWIDCLERDYGNVRAALEWAAESGAVELGLRLGGVLWWFWWMRGYLAEGRERVTQLLARGESTVPAAVRAKALNCAGVLASHQGDYESARSFALASLPVLRALDEPFGIAIALSILARSAESEGDLRTARSLQEEALPFFQEAGDLGGFALTLNSLGDLARIQGDDEAAWAFHERALPIWRSWGDKVGIGIGLHRLGLAACLRGDAATARALYGESLRQFRDIGHPAGIVDCLEGIAGVAAAQGQAERGTRLLGAAEALREVPRAPRVPSRQADYERTRADVRAALGEEAFAAAWAAGRAMSLEQAISYALQDGSDEAPPEPNDT